MVQQYEPTNKESLPFLLIVKNHERCAEAEHAKNATDRGHVKLGIKHCRPDKFTQPAPLSPCLCVASLSQLSLSYHTFIISVRLQCHPSCITNISFIMPKRKASNSSRPFATHGDIASISPQDRNGAATRRRQRRAIGGTTCAVLCLPVPPHFYRMMCVHRLQSPSDPQYLESCLLTRRPHYRLPLLPSRRRLRNQHLIWTTASIPNATSGSRMPS